jgi:hypothetical protein
MQDQRGSPAEGALFLGTKVIPEAVNFPTPSVNCFNHVFSNVGEDRHGTAT